MFACVRPVPAGNKSPAYRRNRPEGRYVIAGLSIHQHKRISKHALLASSLPSGLERKEWSAPYHPEYRKGSYGVYCRQIGFPGVSNSSDGLRGESHPSFGFDPAYNSRCRLHLEDKRRQFPPCQPSTASRTQFFPLAGGIRRVFGQPETTQKRY